MRNQVPQDSDPQPAALARGRPVGVLLLVTLLVTTVVVVTTIVVSFVWTSDRAREDAQRDARYQAEIAADGLEATVGRASTALSTGASSIAVRNALGAPPGCRLQDTGLARYRGSHVDLVLPDGTVHCSSRPDVAEAPPRANGSTEWLAAATRSGAVAVSPVLKDSRSGDPAVVIVAPVRDGARTVAVLGAVVPVAGFADLLGESYAGPRDFTFTVVEPERGDVLSAAGVDDPSGDGTWAEEAGDARAGTWEGLDGREAIFGSAWVPSLRWRIFAGLDASAVTAVARDGMMRQGLLAVVALLALIGLALLVSRRIVKPLQSVTRAVVSARDTPIPAPLEVTGPREVATLASEFNAMIEARTQYEAQLAQRALHDDLTGLPNRSLLRDRLERSLGVEGNRVAVLFLDLDRFKLVNDGLGHPAGDALLQAVARRLEGVVVSPDTLARFGGDEFVVVCEDAGVHEATAMARRLQGVFDSPFALASARVDVSARIGIALGTGPDADPDELVREADIAMYHAKHTGNPYELWTDELRARSDHRLELTQDLRSAIVNGELRVMYQPIFTLDEWRLVGAEALVRWQHPRFGILPPSRFIGLAEDTGQINEVGRHVLEQACHLASSLSELDDRFGVSVNLAEAQLGEELAPSVQTTLDRAGLEPDRLCLELTESSLVAAFGSGAAALRELRDMDIHIAVDDFGTGYSSLSYLQQFPFDTLKVDRSFVQTLGAGDSRAAALIQAILSVAAAFDLRVVAEGVETPEQLAELRRLGCPLVQGFLMSPPLRADALWRLAREQRHQHATG